MLDQVRFKEQIWISKEMKFSSNKAELPLPLTTGIYRRISATSQLDSSAPPPPPSMPAVSARKKSFGDILAYKMAEMDVSGKVVEETSSQHWPIGKEHYELGDIIGEGATAVVHAAYCIPRRESCAVKRINLEKYNTSIDELLREIQAMSACHHENVVSYYTSFVVGEELWLVIRLLAGGSLLDTIRYKMRTADCSHGVLDETTIATVLRDVLKGLEYFHHNDLIHRDIKAGNILLGDDGTVQIADFGVSSWLATDRDLRRDKSRHTFVGTPCWMAPEVMEQVAYNYKADIWSFGITAIELATGAAPYHKYPPMQVLMLVLQNDPPTLETGVKNKEMCKGYGKTFRKLIADCLQKDMNRRPSASELLKHPFFKKAKDKKYLVQSLLPYCPSLESRAKRIRKRRQSAAMGVLTTDNDWDWSDNETSSNEDKATSPDLDVGCKESPTSSVTSQDSGVVSPTSDGPLFDLPSTPSPRPGDLSGPLPPPEKPPAPQFEATPAVTPTVEERPLPEKPASPVAPPPTILSEAPPTLKTLKFLLKIRNVRRELNDIKFEFRLREDTPQSLADELCATGLIENKNCLLVAAALERLLQNPGLHSTTFQLSTNFPEHQLDPMKLIGFAQLSLEQCS